jgi:N-acetylglucosaminyldiphosphoundecaprenol N-acetyl-beta-D-mannosaminyltransferase
LAPDFNRQVYCVLGLPFDAVAMDEAVGHVLRCAARRIPCFLATPNLNWIAACRADARFRDSVVNSDLSVPDGAPLVLMARLLGIPLRQRIAGSSLFERLGQQASDTLSVYFFGGKPGVAEDACRRLNARASGLACAGYQYPGFGSVDDMSSQDAIAAINASGADFLVVSLGASKGQSWIERNRARLTVPVVSHLGAVVNFAAGTARRAPAIVQRIGCEWLWRIKEEPKLWRRYLADGLVFLRLLATRVIPYSWFRLWHRPGEEAFAGATVDLSDEVAQTVIRVSGGWRRGNLAPLRERFANASAVDKDIHLDLRQVTYVDPAFVALVMLLQAHQARRGKQLRFVGAPRAVARVVKYCCAEYLCANLPS